MRFLRSIKTWKMGSSHWNSEE